MKKLIFIKFGGSLITRKDKKRTANLSVIGKLAKEVKKVLSNKKNTFFILGNGAGSFGHYEAIKYKLPSKINSPKKRYGFSVVQESVKTLNKIVVDVLLKEKIPAVSIHQSSILSASKGKLKSIYTESIEGFLKLGMIPVIYGDIVFDNIRGSHIFSTEDAFSILIRKLVKKGYKTEKIIYLTTVDGVLDTEGNVVKKINNLNQLHKMLFKTEGFDVTGGMKHKVKQALLLAKRKIKVYITNGNKKGELISAILHKNFKGTIIE